MRIKSDFHDYYDCIQSYGQDQSLLYIRKITEVPIEKMPLAVPAYAYTAHRDSLPDYCNFLIIGFVGKLYPVFNLSFRFGTQNIYCYSLSDIEKAIAQHCNEKDRAIFNTPVPKKCCKGIGIRMLRCSFADFFERWEAENNSTKMQYLFEQYPLCAIRNGRRGWYSSFNCQLKKYQFFKVKDPAMAFQEISMFLGGLAAPQKPIPTPTDKDMVSIKGFDKHSFRKEPSKNK